jgi:chromosome partitioning protein
MRKIAFINEKGGTCKTTLAVNVAAYLAQKKGLRVLLVDLDTQGHAGKCVGVDVRTVKPNVFHWLTQEEVSLDAVVQQTAIEKLHVIPSYKEMSEFPLEVAPDKKRAYRLDQKLRQAKGRYDAVLFDAPPSMGITTVNILVAAREVVVPVAMTYLSLDGCAEIAETVRSVATLHERPDLKLSLVIPTLYRKTALAQAIHERLRQHFPEALCATPLGFNVKIDEAQSHGQTIWEYAPKSKGAQMIGEIAEEIWTRGAQESRTLADVA